MAEVPTMGSENPFQTWFGIDEARTRRVLGELTARGADHAELYFEYSRSNVIGLEDGIVSRASSSIDQGVGLRAVIGNVKGVWSETATETVQNFYTDILWYGDPVVLGDDMAAQIAAQFGRVPRATGYVSRLAEWCQVNPSPHPVNFPLLAGTVSMPWIGEYSAGFLEALVIAIERIGPAVGQWYFFLGRSAGNVAMNRVVDKLRRLSYCRVFDPGEDYLHALMRSRMAVTYGGYNSLTDLLYLRRPGLIVLRGMQDEEQQIHVRRLGALLANQLLAINEPEANPDNLEPLLRRQLESESQPYPTIKLDGAQTAAHHIGQVIVSDARGGV